MSKISEEKIKYVAKLARLNVSDEEIEKLHGQLDCVFDHIDSLKEVDTSGVEDVLQVSGLNNVFEEDEVLNWQSSGETVSSENLLQSTEFPVENNQILVQSVIKK